MLYIIEFCIIIVLHYNIKLYCMIYITYCISFEIYNMYIYIYYIYIYWNMSVSVFWGGGGSNFLSKACSLIFWDTPLAKHCVFRRTPHAWSVPRVVSVLRRAMGRMSCTDAAKQDDYGQQLGTSSFVLEFLMVVIVASGSLCLVVMVAGGSWCRW